MSAVPSFSWPRSTDQLIDRLSTNKWIPLAVNVAALALLGYAGTQWFARSHLPATSAAVKTVQARAPEQESLDLEPLFSANLFGRLEKTAGETDPEKLPISSLNLSLTGVMARGPAGFAFLSVNNAPEIFLTIGQEVTSGVILENIYPDRIVVRRGNALETVLLKGSEIVLPEGSIVQPNVDTTSSRVLTRPRFAGSAGGNTAPPAQNVENPSDLDEAPPEPRVY
jgi:hypothetical protein